MLCLFDRPIEPFPTPGDPPERRCLGQGLRAGCFLDGQIGGRFSLKGPTEEAYVKRSHRDQACFRSKEVGVWRGLRSGHIVCIYAKHSCSRVCVN